jgi:soluble lytic murein transglycosylase-like protein
MNRKVELWSIAKVVVFLTVIVLLTISLRGLQHSRESNVILTSQIRVIQENKSVADERYKKAVVEWVYDNSKNISYSIAEIIVNAAFANNHPTLILSVISVESEFYPMAVSKKGAIGLGQIMYGYWGKKLEERKIIKSKRDLFDIRDNIAATGYILDTLMEESKGDVIMALRNYLGVSHKKYENDVFTNYVRLSMLREAL